MGGKSLKRDKHRLHLKRLPAFASVESLFQSNTENINILEMMIRQYLKVVIFLWHGSSCLLFTQRLQEKEKGSNRGGYLNVAEGDVGPWVLELLLQLTFGHKRRV